MLASTQLPKTVRIFEVGPRDGLQNEKAPVTLQDKVMLVDQLSAAGIKHIEAGSFVSPKWVPQMADSVEVFAGIERYPDVTYSALTPNMQGLDLLRTEPTERPIWAEIHDAFVHKYAFRDADGTKLLHGGEDLVPSGGVTRDCT